MFNAFGYFLVEIFKFIFFPIFRFIWKIFLRNVIGFVLLFLVLMYNMAEYSGYKPLSKENINYTKQGFEMLSDTIKEDEAVKIIMEKETVKGIKKDFKIVNKTMDKVDNTLEKNSHTYKGVKNDLSN